MLNTSVPGTFDFTMTSEIKRRHSQEKHDADLVVIQALELRLGITWWVIGSTEWEEAGWLVAQCKYQRAFDDLEGQVVAWIFELTKMNQSQTGMSHIHQYIYLLTHF